MTRVIANLLVGANLATAEKGRSGALSFPADRSRFHALRGRARAILIGGATYRAEPYSQTPAPLLVATRDATLLTLLNPTAEFMEVDPLSLIDIAIERFGAPILVEGGVSFMAPLLERAIIDELHLVRSPKSGGSHFFEESLLSRYQLVNQEFDPITGGAFQTWTPK